MYRVKVTSKGQMTIPEEVRDKLGIKSADVWEIKETATGYELQKHVDTKVLETYAGYLRKTETPTTNEVIERLRDK